MRIAYIAAGAAGMYCGSCFHDNALARALHRKGVDFTMVPTYTPMRTDEPSASIDRVFYGGVNVYLQQKLGLFRHTPWFLDRLLDNRALLNGVAKLSGSTRAEDLGALTVSILEGESGPQKKELRKLVRWLGEHIEPDLVQLTNSMFLGMARAMKQDLGVPVLCSLQGEDIFIDGLVEPYRSQTLDLLRERAADADGFVATCAYYADYMSDLLQVARDRVHVVPLGISLDGHGTGGGHLPDVPFSIGYLARICPEKGLHLLADAFRQIAGQVGKERVRLRVAGYLGKRDEAYFEQVKGQIEDWGLTGAFDYRGEVDREQKIAFLNSLHVLSVPTPYRDPKGLFVLEAMANGVPVVQPDHGAFPEMIDATGGGLLVEPDSPEALAEGLVNMMENVSARKAMGQAGLAAVRGEFTDDRMAEATMEVYRTYLECPEHETGRDPNAG